jgi:hypothetical protein
VVTEEDRAAWVDRTDCVVEVQADEGLRRSWDAGTTGFAIERQLPEADADVTSGVDENAEVVVVF